MRLISIILLVILGLAILVVPNAAFMVRETEYGLVLRLGRLKEQIYEPGLHFKTPFVEEAKSLERRLLIADIQDQKVVVQDKSTAARLGVGETPAAPAGDDEELDSEAAEDSQTDQEAEDSQADQEDDQVSPGVIAEPGAPMEPPPQAVTLGSGQRSFLVDAFAAFRIVEPTRFYRIKKTEEAAAGTLSRLLQESLRKVFGAQPFSAVLSEERVNLMNQIRRQLNREASAFGVEVVDVRIQRADLPPANTERTFERMKTSYEEQAKYYRARGEAESDRIIAEAEKDVTISIAEARKEGEITRARGDAKRNRIFAEAFGQDPEFFAFYRSMGAYQKALSSENTTFVLSPESDFFRYFDDDKGGARSR